MKIYANLQIYHQGADNFLHQFADFIQIKNSYS